MTAATERKPRKKLVVENGHDDFQHQMAVQMGWTKPKNGEGTPVPLEESKIDSFPASKGSEMLKLELLYESPHNPRKAFKGIAELAKSIVATGGLLQPIVARRRDNGPHPAYEIAAGARRFRALELLKRQGNPLGEKALVDIRELTDAQMAEAMMAENDQRDGLLPLEQATGYENMLKTGFTVELIAEKLGVSTGTVHGRLALLKLGKKARQLLLDGVLSTAVATPLGRYPHALQDEALERMFNDKAREGMGGPNLWRWKGAWEERWQQKQRDAGDKLLNVGPAIAWLQQHFTKSLRTTVFDQDDQTFQVSAELWPDRAANAGEVTAPSCKACPKNSNNMPAELAGENAHGRSSAGFCTMPPCFDEKWAEAVKRMRAETKTKGDAKVLGETASRAALNKLSRSDSRYAKLGEVNHADKKKRTWGQLLELANEKLDDAEKIRKVLAISEEGRAQLVEKAEVEAVLSADKVLEKKAESSTANRLAEHRRTYEQHEAQAKLRQEIAVDVLKQYTQHLRAKGATLPTLRMLLELAEAAAAGPSFLRLVDEVFGQKSRRELDAFVEKKATANDLVAMLYACMAAGETRAWHGFSDETARAAKELGVDLKKREKDALAAHKAAAKREAGEKETLEEGDE